MKATRQGAILELVAMYDIETQDDLIDKLRKEGYNVTQATVSRDIRELKLTKVPTGYGGSRYVRHSAMENISAVKFNNALVDSIIKADYAGNNIVLRTYPGLAGAVATGIDGIQMAEILGCVAGDDTIIIVARDSESAKEISEKIRSLVKGV